MTENDPIMSELEKALNDARRQQLTRPGMSSKSPRNLARLSQGDKTNSNASTAKSIQKMMVAAQSQVITMKHWYDNLH